MRQLIVATGIAIIAVSSHAQSSTAQTPAAAATESAEPALTKSVVLSAGDSPLVRAAKIAVASRQNPAKRRVITIGTSAGRGRFSLATGPTQGPSVPPSSTAYAAGPTESQIKEANQQKAQAAQVQKRLNQLAQEEQRVGAEIDEPYGGDIEEDAVEKRLSDIADERQKLQQPPPPPPQE